jgi:hypothetical protein
MPVERRIEPTAILIAQIACGRGVFDFHLRPVAFELFGDDHRQRGDGALPHLVVRRADEDAAIGVNRLEGVDLVWRAVGPPSLRGNAGGVG